MISLWLNLYILNRFKVCKVQREEVLFVRRLILVFLCLVMIVGSSSLPAIARDLTELGLAESYDLGGNTVTIISWTAARIESYLNEDPVTRGRIEEAEELFNCKIEFLQTRDIPNTNFNRLLSGDSAYDLWFTQSRIGYYEIVSNDAAYPMGDILPEAYYDSLSNYEKDSIDLLGYYGKTYGIGKMHFGTGVWNTGGIVMFYNKTLLEELGVADPWDYYKADQWDWSTATQMMQKITRDIDGDGTIDIWGIADPIAYSFVISNGGSVTKVLDDGRIVYSMDEPAAVEGLELYADWHAKGVVGGSFDNRTAAFRMRFLNAGGDYLDFEDEWSVVPFPKGAREDKYYYPEWSPETTLIPVNAVQPEALAALKAFLFRPDDVPLNVVMARTVRDQNAAEIFMELQNNWVPQARYLFESFGGNLVEDAIKKIRDGEISPAVGTAEIKPQVQALLDDFQDSIKFQF